MVSGLASTAVVEMLALCVSRGFKVLRLTNSWSPRKLAAPTRCAALPWVGNYRSSLVKSIQHRSFFVVNNGVS